MCNVNDPPSPSHPLPELFTLTNQIFRISEDDSLSLRRLVWLVMQSSLRTPAWDAQKEELDFDFEFSQGS